MLQKIQIYSKKLLTVIYSFFGGFVNLAILTVIALIVGYLSHYILGDDNPVEQSMEGIVNGTVEQAFHLPQHTINIDLSKTDEHNKSA